VFGIGDEASTSSDIGEERLLPLMRGRLVGYDAKRMVFIFTMMHGAKIIDCEISSTALDDLAGVKGVRPNEREAQVMRLRDKIERLTSDNFGKNGMQLSETIRIFSKHIKGRYQKDQ
jgi:hypothetical protein